MKKFYSDEAYAFVDNHPMILDKRNAEAFIIMSAYDHGVRSGHGYNYRKEVLRNLNPEHVPSDRDVLALGGMGLAGEAGECVDLIKKHLFHKVPLDRDKLIKELGDVRWYFEVLCHAAGITITEVERLNVEKLRKRFPNGFNTVDSIKKADER